MGNNFFNQRRAFKNKSGINLDKACTGGDFSRAAITESIPPTPIIGKRPFNSVASIRIISVLFIVMDDR